jgi:hypothetical protein
VKVCQPDLISSVDTDPYLVLQNPAKYKIRPGPKKTAKEKAPKIPSTENLSPILTRGLLKQGTSGTTPDTNSPCQKNALENGMERAFTFAVEEGTSDWNLLENNLRKDPIPPEPVALNEARLLCREAMTLITEEVCISQIPTPPSQH